MFSIGTKQTSLKSCLQFFGQVLSAPVLLFVLALYPAISTASPSNIDSISASVLALDSARKMAVQEFADPMLSAQELTDAQDFVIYLNTRIITYCRQLQQLDAVSELEALPCPSEEMLTRSYGHLSRASGSPAPPQAPTRAEKTGSLHTRFLESLGEFDDMLLEEEARAAAKPQSQRESGTAAGSDLAGTESGRAGQTGTATGAMSGDGAADGDPGVDTAEATGTFNGEDGVRTEAGPGEAAGASSDTGALGARGGSVPPPEDDDIVARQLREAAENEPDPELKKKLWEEYWKYKGEVRQ